MRAMPSPISSTRPTSSALSLSRYCAISFWRTETISSALNLITTSLDELFLNGLEPAADRRIDPPIADLHDHSGDQIGIDPRFKHRLLVELGPDFLTQGLGLIVGQRHGTHNPHAHEAGTLIVQIAVRRMNGPQRVEPLVLVE